MLAELYTIFINPMTKIWQQWFPDALGFSVTIIEVVIVLAMQNLKIAIVICKKLFLIRCI